MRVPIVLSIGLLLGALPGASIFFVPAEPYPIEIFLATTLRTVLVALLVGLTLRESGSWMKGMGYGALYGLALGLVVFLAKGGFQSWSAPYVVPYALVIGAIAGLLVNRFGYQRA